MRGVLQLPSGAYHPGDGVNHTPSRFSNVDSVALALETTMRRSIGGSGVPARGLWFCPQKPIFRLTLLS